MAFSKVLTCGGVPLIGLEKFCIPYGTLTDMIFLGMRSYGELHGRYIHKMTDPVWFNLICASRIHCKNFMLRVDTFSFFEGGVKKPRHHSNFIAVKFQPVTTPTYSAYEFCISKNGEPFVSAFVEGALDLFKCADSAKIWTFQELPQLTVFAKDNFANVKKWQTKRT